MLHVPLESADGIIYLSVPLGCRLWTKELSKLELAADMVRSVMAGLASCRQVILLCDSWYPKKPVTGLVEDYMVRSVKGIERLANLTCISYAAVRLLPYYSMAFQGYQGQSPQEIRYQLGEKIRMNIIIHSLGQTIKTIKKELPLKKAFQELMRKCGYLYRIFRFKQKCNVFSYPSLYKAG
ncbi:MAG: hypothetical protein K2O06_15085 [Acetatifactor sp.]|nr:hypothetical protein [Acetatifactor sp.]